MHRPKQLRLNLTPEFRALLERAAALEGCSVNEFAVGVLHRAVQAVVQPDAVINLTTADQNAVAQALLNPDPPNPALVRAFARKRQLLR